MLAHLKRELIHGSLRLVFGGGFADAKKNGRVTLCADDVLRRWILEVILHSADYMEKYVCGCLGYVSCVNSYPGQCWSP